MKREPWQALDEGPNQIQAEVTCFRDSGEAQLARAFYACAADAR